MAGIWAQQKKDEESLWGVASLEGAGEAFYLTGDPKRPVAVRKSDSPHGQGAYIIRHEEPDGRERWALFAAPAARARVNGVPLSIGMHVLTDKDEIQLGNSGPLLFSTERLARTEPFPGTDKPVFCPRCKAEILPGQPSVRCPACGVWHHEDPVAKRPCWTYHKALTCALCDHPNTLEESGYCWTPEDI